MVGVTWLPAAKFPSMNPFPVSAFGFACVLAGVATVRAVDLQTLVDRSPFSPSAQVADASGNAEPQGTLEFRGMVTDAAGTAYSLFDTATNKGRWLRAGDADSAVQVKGFDAGSHTLELEQNGRPVRLTLKRAIIQAGQPLAAMNAAAASAPSPGVSRVAGLGGRTRANLAKAPADPTRLKAISEAVRERRKLRAGNSPQAQAPAQTLALPVASGS